MISPLSGLELQSTITSTGVLELILTRQEILPPGPGEILIRVEAAPINPADVLVLLGPADRSSLSSGERSGLPLVTGKVSPDRLLAIASRLDQALPLGNEGAGTVIDAGPGARHLIGRAVALRDRMFSQYRVAKASDCLLLPDGMTPLDGASACINPITVLSMIDTMVREHHRALVHTAAASSVGQMLNRVLPEGRHSPRQYCPEPSPSPNSEGPRGNLRGGFVKRGFRRATA